MKPRTFARIVAILVFVGLTIPVQLAAQQHHHYKLIILGTLDGPQSFFGAMNNRGLAAGVADTATLDPYTAPNPLAAFGPDPYVFHAFVSNGRGHLVDLGALPGPNSSSASSIAENGLVVGQSLNGTSDPVTGILESNAVLWRDGKIINLGTLGGYESSTIGVNSRGQVAGIATNSIPDPFSVLYFVIGGGFSNGTQTRGFTWDEKNGMRDVGTLGGPDTFPQVMNERGEIAGASYTNDIPSPTEGFPTTHLFLWGNGKMTDLGTLGGFFGGLPNAINNRGEVVGFSDLPGDAVQHAFLWSNGKLTDIGTLGGTYGEAFGLNNAGDAVGISLTAGDVAFHAFLWRRGVITDLGPMPNIDASCVGAFGINAKSQVVGQAVENFCQGPAARAFLWENGDMIDLNAFVPPASDLTLTDVRTINDRGEIFGLGSLPNGDDRAFLLIPCDENHPNLEGCDYSPLAAAALAQSRAVSGAEPKTIDELSMFKERIARMVGRHGGFLLWSRRWF